MIVTSADPTATTVSATGERIRWRSLARRGMLHSECNAVDYLVLDPYTEFALRNRDGSEGAWLVLAGGGTVHGRTAAGADSSPPHRDGSPPHPDASLSRSEGAPADPDGSGGATGNSPPRDGERLRVADLVLAGCSADAVLRAGPAGMSLLWLDLMPASLAGALPSRKPVV